MNIVIIHAQNRKQTSFHIGRMLIDKVGKQEDVQEFFLPVDMPHFCIGCYNCLKDIKYCPHYQSLQPILDAMDAADLLIFTTPVYCLRTTGSMKAFLDHCFTQWISHRPKTIMYYKQAVVVSVGAGVGMGSAAKDIETSLSYWGISNIQILKQRSLAESWNDVNDKIKVEIEQKTSRIVEKVKRQKNSQRVLWRRKIMFMMIRQMNKAGKSASVEDTNYWREQGWLEKKRPWK